MNHKIFKIALKAAFFMLLLSGFAQMPIFKRYYIADIPGFGWLADFELTHALHYGFAIVFCLLFFYHVALEMLVKRYTCLTKKQVTDTLINHGLTIGIVSTGMILVLKNFPGYHMAPEVIVGLDIMHLGLVMTLLGYKALGFVRLKYARQS